MRISLFLSLAYFSALGLSWSQSTSPVVLSTSARNVQIGTDFSVQSIPALYTLCTGRRLSVGTVSLPVVTFPPGAYTSDEFKALLARYFEDSSLEVVSVTDSLDYLRRATYSPRLLPGLDVPPSLGSDLPVSQTPAVAPYSAVAPSSPPVVPEPAPAPYRLAPVVLVSAEIGAVRIGSRYERGVDFLAALDSFAASSAPGSLALGKGISGGIGALQLGSSPRPLSDFFKVLDTDTDYSSISRPRFEVVSGGTGRIATGQRVAVPTQTLNTFTGQAATASNIEYRDVQLSFEVTPHVVAGGKVALRITQSDDSISGSQVISGNTVPTIASQTFSTETVMNVGDTIALGGMVIKRTTKDSKGVSGLRKVPLLGRLFGSRSNESGNSELVILLTVHVLK